MEKQLYVHDNRGQLKDALDNGYISKKDYDTAEVVAYGEGYEGMANHTLEMSGLDRIIFEDCVFSGGQVQAPHVNINDVPYYRRPETIARKAKCSLEHAADLCQFWSTIGNTQSMVKEFVAWVQAKGISPALKYFGNLAAQLGEAECVSPEEFIMSLGVEVIPNEYRYHPIGEKETPELDYYEDIAPGWLKGILRNIEQAKTTEVLSAIGKQAFEAHMGVHTGTFWMHYNAKKAELTPELSQKAEEIIEFIHKSNGYRLGKVGKRLFELQAEGELSKPDWSRIWEAYHKRKECLGKK